MEGLQCALAARYRIEGEIGRGGMAIVYAAEDVKHHRRVAIKVLKPDIAAALGPERFLREIDIAARLTHPNILPLHDSGDAGGLLYYVMPYVEGETLRARLIREQQLPVAEAVQIASEIAEALGYAHSLGLIHRDIKPENILFQAGHAVVSDFGIARAMSQATGAGGLVTESGIAVGTMAYMSPEQSAGKKDLDGRSDLYSLGCVLFEMLAGEVPLGSADIRGAHAGGSVPLAGVIAKALARVPADRFATALQFQEALRVATGAGRPTALDRRWRLRVAAALAVLVGGVASWYGLFGRHRPDRTPRVAVAPFEDRTGEPRLAQLGDLAADWITRGISRAQSFDVTAAAVAREAWSTDGVRALVQRTGATVIVSGAYVLDRDVVRFDAEIIDARSGRLITDLDSVTTPANSVVPAIAKLAERVAGALVAQLGPQLTGTTGSNPPTLEAFRQYQMGLDIFSRGEWEQAIVHFKRAIAIDSTYPPPVVWAAMAYQNLGRHGAADTMLMNIRGRVDRLTPLEQVTFEWIGANIRGDRAEGLRWVEQAFRMEPRDWAYPYGLALLSSNRPRQALQVLPLFNRETPFGRNWDPYWLQTGNAHHLLGEYRQELRLAREWRGANAPRLRQLGLELRALAALGNVAELERVLVVSRSLPSQGQGRARRTAALVALIAAEELRRHGRRDAANSVLDSTIAHITRGALEADALTRGRALYLRERWADALVVFDSLHRAQPQNIEYLGYVAVTHARLGNRERAAAANRELAQSDRPYDRGEHTRWRARLAAVLGDAELAVRLLRQAADEGIRLGIELHGDVDLEGLLDYPPFQAFTRPQG